MINVELTSKCRQSGPTDNYNFQGHFAHLSICGQFFHILSLVEKWTQMQFESHFNLQQIKEPKFIMANIILWSQSDRAVFTKRVQIFTPGKQSIKIGSQTA